MREPDSSSPRTYEEVIGERLRDNRRKWEKREVQTGYKENLFHHEDSQALEQVTQRGCASLSLEG